MTPLGQRGLRSAVGVRGRPLVQAQSSLEKQADHYQNQFGSNRAPYGTSSSFPIWTLDSMTRCASAASASE